MKTMETIKMSITTLHLVVGVWTFSEVHPATCGIPLETFFSASTYESMGLIQTELLQFVWGLFILVDIFTCVLALFLKTLGGKNLLILDFDTLDLQMEVDLNIFLQNLATV